ncbi:MAG: hypothetical protein K6U04_15260 [Armatimonadetes bacterium]|nr:hypothetical protein [Armatimonadota bacterium]
MLKDQRGFIAMYVLLIFLVIAFSCFAFIGTAALGAKKNAVMTYQWFGEAINFAADAVSRARETTDFAVKTSEARQWFVYAFSQELEATTDGYNFNSRLKIYPGPIKLVSFNYAPPGTVAPGGGRTAGPGYEAVIEVPVLSVNLPFIGPQYVTVPMRQVGVVKAAAER